MREIARWESRGGKYWISLVKHGSCDYRYKTDNGGGCLVTNSDGMAIVSCEDMAREVLKYDGITLRRVESE